MEHKIHRTGPGHVGIVAEMNGTTVESHKIPPTPEKKPRRRDKGLNTPEFNKIVRKRRAHAKRSAQSRKQNRKK